MPRFALFAYQLFFLILGEKNQDWIFSLLTPYYFWILLFDQQSDAIYSSGKKKKKANNFVWLQDYMLDWFIQSLRQFTIQLWFDIIW